MPEFVSQSTARRAFLLQCTRAATVFFVPVAFSRPNSAAPEFHLHPHYREQTPLDTALLQLKPGLDGFLNEVDHDRIAVLLDNWSRALLESPSNSMALYKDLSNAFEGVSWQPAKSEPLRFAASPLHVHRLTFKHETNLSREAFLAELQSSLSIFSKLLTVEFQITSIASDLTTRVRYELVGTGPGFHREQRSGHWSLTWNAGQVTRWQAQSETRSRTSQPFFTDISEAALGSNSSYFAQLLQGADHWREILDGACGIDIYGHNGVSAAGIFGSGLDDLYICQPAGLPNLLFRNRGNGTFEDVTNSSGLGILENTACALFADFTNNGRQDAVIVRAAGPLLYINEGNGKFRFKPNAFQFATPPQGTFTGAAAADYNRDGRLDIYFCLYSYYQGADQYRYPAPYFDAANGPPNFLLHNNGDATFSDVTTQTGLNQNNTRYSFCCSWSDYNHDGWPDLYVVNDFGRKNLYRNNGNGTFTDIAAEAGVEDIGAGMSVSWFDYDNDGADDLYVANMWTAAGERLTADKAFQESAPRDIQALYRKHAMGNSLFRNTVSSFRNATVESQTSVGRWSWASDAWDFDHDGHSDIYVVNGMISGPIRQDLNSFFWRQVVAKSPNAANPSSDYEQGWNAINELIREGYSWSGFERNVLFVNNRDGAFSEVSGALGLDFLEDGRSFVLADIDGDGRQELILKSRNQPQVRILKNTLAALPPSISFRLQGTKSNRDAIGASVTIQTNIGQQTKCINAGSGFLSQHSKELIFGLGDSIGPVSVVVNWPSGLTQRFTNLPPGHRISINEGAEPSQTKLVWKGGDMPPRNRPGPPTNDTWLLLPLAAPGIQPGKAQLLRFETTAPDDDQTAIYNLLFRHIYDSHRDMTLPTSFLMDDNAQIVKIYQGPVDSATVDHDLQNIPSSETERFAKALPFPGVSTVPGYTRNYLSLGGIFFQRGYPEPAKTYFESALKDDPASAEALYGLGSVYLKQQQKDQARDCFERAAGLKSSYPETTPNAWNNLGLLSARDGDTAKAIGYFERSLQLNPNHFVALQNLGNAYRQQHNWSEAQAALQRALALKPSDPEANYSLGMVFAQLDDTAKAAEYLKLALQMRPVYPEALNNLGILYLRTRHRDQAVASFEKCIQLAPGFDQSYLNLARVYAVEGDSVKARTVLEALIKQRPDDTPAKQALAQLNQK